MYIYFFISQKESLLKRTLLFTWIGLEEMRIALSPSHTLLVVL